MNTEFMKWGITGGNADREEKIMYLKLSTMCTEPNDNKAKSPQKDHPGEHPRQFPINNHPRLIKISNNIIETNLFTA